MVAMETPEQISRRDEIGVSVEFERVSTETGSVKVSRTSNTRKKNVKTDQFIFIFPR